MMDIKIAHISDPHVSKINFMPEKLETAISEINTLNPDIVILSGDITMFGFENEYGTSPLLGRNHSIYWV
jgi:Icc protein